MSRPQLNLQDIFLNQVRKDNVSVTIYLVNGVQLRGIVRGFDAFTVLLESPGRPTQLVYKHAVTSVVPSRPLRSFSGDAERDPDPKPVPPPADTDPNAYETGAREPER